MCVKSLRILIVILVQADGGAGATLQQRSALLADVVVV